MTFPLKNAVRQADPYLGMCPDPADLAKRQTLCTITNQHLRGEFRELAVRHGINLRVELKLRTEQGEFWLCTQGLAKDGPASPLPRAWTTGTVTIAYPKPCPNGRLTDTYDEEDYIIRQAVDAIKRATRRRMERRAEYERNPSSEIATEVESLNEEVHKAIASFAATLHAIASAGNSEKSSSGNYARRDSNPQPTVPKTVALSS